jgi:hypothetical protein
MARDEQNMQWFNKVTEQVVGKQKKTMLMKVGEDVFVFLDERVSSMPS